MSIYWQIAKNTWAETFTYRFSFITYRVRMILQILTIYFLWMFFLPSNATFLGYNQSHMLTYVLGTMLVSSIIMASRSQAIGQEINQGNLSIFLIRPINYLLYWFARDLGDKAVNIIFTIIELSFLFVLLHPPFFLQQNVWLLLATGVATILGLVLYFYFSVLIGFLGFWSNEIWGPRFVFYQILSFFAGSLFPLDILPKPLFAILQYLPFSYLMYFPLKIYLGDVSTLLILKGVIITGVWIVIMHKITLAAWQKGLKVYTAYGR